jgi:hypothetical protein
LSEKKICPRDAGELAACFAVHADGLFGYACMLTRGDRAAMIWPGEQTPVRAGTGRADA